MSLALRPRAALLAVALSTALGTLVPSHALAAKPAAPAKVDIPYEQFTLPNGLRVIVHTDRKAPIVAVNVWYHVGSKDEPAGRTGFAHLFEHLMFQGSETTTANSSNRSSRWVPPTRTAPPTPIAPTISKTCRPPRWTWRCGWNRTAWAIWSVRSTRPRWTSSVAWCRTKRQGENQPYGQAWDQLNKALYPVGHPYHHGVIGSMNDLNAASLDDVKTWFRTWYGPNNAVLVLAGDIDLATAKEKVARYFGSIPAGPTMAQPAVNVAKRSADTRETMTDKVPQRASTAPGTCRRSAPPRSISCSCLRRCWAVRSLRA